MLITNTQSLLVSKQQAFTYGNNHEKVKTIYSQPPDHKLSPPDPMSCCLFSEQTRTSKSLRSKPPKMKHSPQNLRQPLSIVKRTDPRSPVKTTSAESPETTKAPQHVHEPTYRRTDPDFKEPPQKAHRRMTNLRQRKLFTEGLI
ncbi:uncharacterized protein EV154DRAFT_478911 [Mucor mucedo]|uniref:uncharacterized protein n=1 Tax=Mucor mucedo TaxID=29922 RepID=UPI00221F5BCA|nr:uncharacterized protein EV154DRAFT_478911 [Mucor mucedo]KAI7893861.1 hypothetical protein EV154DRAFT_478911 [Mucor mucedo]